jgi:hypothetical protein
MSERALDLVLEAGGSITLTKASNGLGRGIRFELFADDGGHNQALVRLTPDELLRVAATIAVELGYAPRPS